LWTLRLGLPVDGLWGGFLTGRIYWFGCVISIPIELIACAKFLNFWLKDVDQYLIMGLVLIFLTVINCLVVKSFGEIEYWLSLIKISAIVFFIIVTSKSLLL
jgi:lysine-specific permease